MLAPIYFLLCLPLLPLFFLLYIAHKIAFPPWHHPNPISKTLTLNSLPATWTHFQPPIPHISPSFPTHSSHTLRSWLLPSSSTPSPIAIACVHGAGRDRRAFLSHALFLVNHGFDCLLFDCLNHGISDANSAFPWPGRAVGLGSVEYKDVNAAVMYLLKRGNGKVVVMGTSQGASAAIIAAAKFPNIAALILENPFTSPRALVEGIVDAMIRRFKLSILRWAKPLIVWFALLRTGNTPGLCAEEFVGEVHVPVFFVHGRDDDMVSWKQSQSLFRKVAHERKKIWIVEGASHTKCFWKEPQVFEQRILTFLTEFVAKTS